MQLPGSYTLWQLSCLHSVWEETNKGQMRYYRWSPFLSFEMCIYHKFIIQRLFFLSQTDVKQLSGQNMCHWLYKEWLAITSKHMCTVLCLIVCEQTVFTVCETKKSLWWWWDCGLISISQWKVHHTLNSFIHESCWITLFITQTCNAV